MRKFISVICVAVLISGLALLPILVKNKENATDEDAKSFGFTTEQKKEISLYNDNFDTVAENENFLLSVDRKNVNISLTDKRNNKTYYSSPLNSKDDGLATSTVKSLMDSFLIIKYAQRDSGIITKGAKKNSVEKNGAYIKNIDNGMRIYFYFPLEKFLIPVEIVLNKSGLDIKVLADEISETASKFKLASVQVMPYFGCSLLGSDGYTFVPDGCGAIIENTKNAAGFSAYSKPVYGRDLSVMLDNKSYDNSKIHIPVFGLKTGDSGFAGIIKKGDSNAKINAVACGINSSYNSICSEMVYRQTENVVYQTNNNMGWMNLTEFEKNHFAGDYVVGYSFISDNADYSKMAEIYKQYLLENKQIYKSDFVNKDTLYVDLIGGVKRQESVLGFPAKRVTAITPFDSVKKITSALNNKGIKNITYRYTYWQDGGDSLAVYDDIRAEGRLGGNSALKKMLALDKGSGSRVILDLNLMNMNKSACGLNKKYDCVQSIRKEPVVNYKYRINTEVIDKSVSDTYLVNPVRVEKIAKNLSKNISKYLADGYSLNTVGSLLYSDFGKSLLSRQQAIEEWIQIAKNFKNKTSLTFDSPNAYMFSLADEIINSPFESEHNNIFSYDVPFYQMVVSDYIPTSLHAGNSFGNKHKALLKAIEFGSNLKFDLGYQNIDLLSKTSLSDLNYTDYSLWKDGIANDYKKWTDFRKICGFSGIKSHKYISKNVYLTVYGNGTAVYTNYNNKAVNVGSITVPAMDFILGDDMVYEN